MREIKGTVSDKGCCCCNVVALVSVDERGQMVLPKDLREKMGIRPGDKLALVAIEKDSQLCCISLLKTEALSELVKDALKPLMQEVF